MYCSNVVQHRGQELLRGGVYTNSKTTVVSTAVSDTAALIAVRDTVDVRTCLAVFPVQADCCSGWSLRAVQNASCLSAGWFVHDCVFRATRRC